MLTRIDHRKFPPFERFAAPERPRTALTAETASTALAAFASRCRAVEAARR